MISLDLKMANGASVSDWLGTAGVKVNGAAKMIQDMRDPISTLEVDSDTLEVILTDLKRAANEILEVRMAVEESEPS